MKMFRLFFLMTILTGIIYPAIVTILGSTIFPEKSRGSLVTHQGKIIGSELLSQKFSSDNFFYSRASSSDFNPIGSSATQASPTNATWKKKFFEQKNKYPDSGNDGWTSSASGLDPHISPKTAFSQIKRIAAERSMSEEDLSKMIEENIENPTLGIWGQPRVNVLKLNLSLENKGIDGKTGRTSPEP